MLRIIYSKKGKIIHVTFKLKNPETAALSGEFKSWSLQKNPMKNLKNGSFSVTPSLKARTCQSRQRSVVRDALISISVFTTKLEKLIL
jgi:hypothetical protein